MTLERYALQLDAEFRKDCALLGSDGPWFGHFTLEDEGGAQIVLRSWKVGGKTIPSRRIVSWLAPVGRFFYENNAGDYVDIHDYHDGSQRYADIAGVLQRKTTLVTHGRTVTRLVVAVPDGQHTLEKGVGGYTVLDEVAAYFAAKEGLPDIRALLSPEQYKLITRRLDSPVIIQGQAGSGKTTVALYRVSWLISPEANSNPLDAANVLIVMFNKALQSFVSSQLTPLGLDRARLDTFHGWALEAVKRAYKGELEPRGNDAKDPDQSKASELKKHIGMLSALDAFVQRQTANLLSWISGKLAPYKADAILEELNTSNTPIVQRLVAIRSRTLTQRNQAAGEERERLSQIHAVLQRSIERMTLYKEELFNFLTDKALLQTHLQGVSSDDLDALERAQRIIQDMQPGQKRPGLQVSFDDLSLILRLLQLKHGGLPDKQNDDQVTLYDHLMIDEAQDFGALDMNVLLSAVKARTGVTIVGDINQKIIPSANFMGWDALGEALGVGGATVATLEVAYRSTRQIMAVACSVLGIPSSGGRSGALPEFHREATDEGVIKKIQEHLARIFKEVPTAHIAVVCKSPKDVEPLVTALGMPDASYQVRKGHNKEFVFAPGVTVTNLHQVKGLEFDAVIVVEPSAENYRADDQGRKNLYTVITRARDHLVLIGQREPSPLLNEALENGWIASRKPVAEVTFTEDEELPF